jgi:hypothetical protein
MNDYYTIEETEKGIDGLLPIPKRTQANYRKQGLLQFLKVGRQIYYRLEHLNNLFSKLENLAVHPKNN